MSTFESQRRMLNTDVKYDIAAQTRSFSQNVIQDIRPSVYSEASNKANILNSFNESNFPCRITPVPIHQVSNIHKDTCHSKDFIASMLLSFFPLAY